MPEAGVTLRFRMEGYEEIQQQLEQVEVKEDEIIEKTQEVEEKVTRSLSATVAGISAVVRVGMDVLDVFGITIDVVLKETVNLILGFVTQIALIATSMAPVNAPYAAALAIIAATMQARAIQLQATGASESKEAMDKARRLMSDLTTSIIIITR